MRICDLKQKEVINICDCRRLLIWKPAVCWLSLCQVPDAFAAFWYGNENI
ncbi:MAG: hypothetical protein K0R23_3207 [Lacrimispora sp.]|nr:hypothetical protein [Lacrimispora sp.]